MGIPIARESLKPRRKLSRTRPVPRRIGTPRRHFPVSSSSVSLAEEERAWSTWPGNSRVLNRQARRQAVSKKLAGRSSLRASTGLVSWQCGSQGVPHDHVVAIHRVDETEEWLWLVIEYVSGGTLKARLTELLPPRDAARLTETIARAVEYFHTRGVCHLDLKPSNILIEGEPGAPWEIISPKISDFGIARVEGEPGTTETGANGPKGTPSYMAPEQVAALPGTIGPSADIYALARSCTIY